jgi:hypothetical protein
MAKTAEQPGANVAAGARGGRAWRRAASILAFAGIAAAATAAGFQLAGICVTERGLPMWDRAYHGLAGVDLALALRHGDIPAFLLGLNRQVTWPFVHSLLLAPWLLVRGYDYAAADQLSSLLFAGTVLAVFAAGLGLHPERGAWVGAAAAALALLAPDYRLFGTLAMLEMPGAFFLALTLALWIREVQSPASRGLSAAAGLSTTALFLCKYNYGLLWVAPLAWHLWSTAESTLKHRMLERARAAFRSRRWVRPFPLFMLAYALVLLVILVTGGSVFRVRGASISVRSPGNPAYLFYLILLAWGALAVRRAGGVHAVWRKIPPRYRMLAATVLLPLAVWFFIPVPNRVKEFFGFIVNRGSGSPLWTLEGLLYYPRAFVQGYSPSPALGWLVLALACVPPPGRRAADRLLYSAFAFGLLATMAHHYHDPRFLFTTALLVWLRAAQTAIGLLDQVLRHLHKVVWLEETAWALALASLLVLGWVAAPPRAAVAAAHRQQNSPSAFGPVLDRMLHHLDRAPGGSVVLGCSNWLSPGLLRWETLKRRPEMPASRWPTRPAWLPEGADDARIAARIERLRASGRVVISAVPAGASPPEARDYRAEVWADSVTEARLAKDPAVVEEARELLGNQQFPLKVSVFRFEPTRAGGPGASRR